MRDIYSSLLGGKQAARLNDLVALLHENMLVIQKMFSDSAATKIIKTDKTTNVLHEQWGKKRGKTCKTLTYQDGAKKDSIIDIEIREQLSTRKHCSINQIRETKNIALMLLKGFPNKKNTCWFNYVLTAMINDCRDIQNT